MEDATSSIGDATAAEQQQRQQLLAAQQQQQQGCRASGIFLCVAAIACAVFTVMLIYALSSTSVGLIDGDCPMLWQVMATRCIMAAVVCVCIIAARACGCMEAIGSGMMMMIAVYGLLFLFFAGFAVAEGVVAFRSTVDNGACVSLLEAQSVTGTALLAFLGWAGMVGDAITAVCLLVCWYIDFGAAIAQHPDS